MTSSVFSTIRIQALFFLLLFCTTTNAQNDTTVVLHDIPMDRISHMDYNSGSLLIAASDEWAIMYPETGMQIFASRFSDSRIISTCFLPDGRYAAFLLEDIKTKHTVLKICDISNAEVVANLKAPAGVSFTSMAVWGAENLLLIAGSDGTLRFFDWKFQKTTQSIKLYNGKRAVSLSAGGNYAIIADETQTAYWIDLSKKKVIKSFGVYNGYKGCPLTISPSGQKVY